MKALIIFISVLIVIQACNSRQESKSGNTEQYQKDSTLIKFGLPYKNISVDSNTLIFYSMKHFDTSILVHLEKQDNIVKGVYYQVLPVYHRNVSDYRGDEKELLFFDGFTFKIDTLKWRQIKNAINNNLLLQDTTASRESCLDCTDYILAHKLKVGRSSNMNRSDFALFEQLIKDSLVKPFKVLKQPLLHK